MKQPSSTTIQRKHVNKCKNTRTHLTTKKNGVLQKFSTKRRLGEDENGDEEKKREEEEKVTKTYLFFSLLIGLNKEKKQSQRYF